MGNIQSTKKISYEDIQLLIKQGTTNILLINTLSITEQECLIPNTIEAHLEESMINENIKNLKINIILYGKNACDKNVETKYLKLNEIGFTNIFIYPGGMFQWLCLQDIYGEALFPTTKKELDILKFKPPKVFFK
tara:strand:- start:118 stop:522 length:405 start_codon:yes stop_codon:yes gene_type:complete